MVDVVLEILAIYYRIFVLIVILINGFLIYCVMYKSCSGLKSYRALLIYSAANQMLTGFLAFMLQPRLIMAGKVVAILFFGPASSIFNQHTCVLLHIFLIGVYANIMVATMNSMYYRYKIVTENGTNIIRNIIISLLLPFCLWILGIADAMPFDDDYLMKAINATFPHYRLERFGQYSGMSRISWITMSAFMVIPFGIPVMGTILGIKISKITKNSMVISEVTKDGTRNLLKVFQLQMITPWIFHLPPSIAYTLAQLLQFDAVVIEHTIWAWAVLNCIIDPLLCLYYVPAYKRFICKIFNRPLVSRIE